MDVDAWFLMVNPFRPSKDLDALREGIEMGFLNVQDWSGATALSLSCSCGWAIGVKTLLAAGADTECRYLLTGTTALRNAVERAQGPFIRMLLAAGANPDAADYWGTTPRMAASGGPFESAFAKVAIRPILPADRRIQNAELLAEHFYPRFLIPEIAERRALKVGTAVNLHVRGPNPPNVKVRISRRRGRAARVRYDAVLDPIEQITNLPPGTREVTFGPEHVTTIYLQDDPEAAGPS